MALSKRYNKKRNLKKRSQQYRNKPKKYGMKKSFGKSSNVSLGMGQKHYATLTETILLVDLNVNTTYSQNFVLADFDRASAVASNFKFYRAKRVTYKYEPLFNFYQDTGGTSDSLPYMYAVMNRTQDNYANDANQLRGYGAVPQVFNSTKTISYKPNWCAQGLGTYSQTAPDQPITSINGTGLRKCYDWLECPRVGHANANQIITPNLDGNVGPGVVPMANYTSAVIYNGHSVRFDQVLNVNTSDIARVTVTVEWEFKGPKIDTDVIPQPGEGIIKAAKAV